MAMSVIAQYKYSYDYEGKRITFTKGEQFKMVSKANNDWWQVQRCLEDGTLETIYVPANYMKLEEEPKPAESHYANIVDFKMEYQKAKEEMSKQPDANPKPPRRGPKVTRTKSHTLVDDRAPDLPPHNGHLPLDARAQARAKRKSSEPAISPTELKGIWGHGDESSRDVPPPGTRPHGDQRKQLESLLNKQLSGGAVQTLPTNTTTSSLNVPVTKPKPKKGDRPTSYYHDNEEVADSSTFKSHVQSTGQLARVSPSDEPQKLFKKMSDETGKVHVWFD